VTTLVRAGVSISDLQRMRSTEGTALSEMLRWEAGVRLRRNRDEVEGKAMPVIVIGDV